MIRFLIKSAIWLSLAFIVMPRFFPAEQENKSAEKPAAIAETRGEPSTVDQLLANGKTAIEIGKLCMNNPSFCENGTSMISSAGSGLLKGSGQMLDYLSQRFGNKSETPADPQPVAVAEKPETTVSEILSEQAAPQTSGLINIPIPTSRAAALRALDRRTTGAIPAKH
ncbi:hypothetical protein D8666_00150 [Ochrobactrum soli]|uniref:Cytoplasmic protein n=1 Tax=Ochrobactrum teleogrylli TaxID=2479765 RepID=A0ABY2Y6E1_9HYPH|nr:MULTISPECIES: hypothetical protein [Brucella]WHT42878.1 hypothetical protein QLQ11_05260 [Ochrobactrum sp. SSR]MDX4074725.1 hypothetical protein [Brucella sp. NBRC 113783]RLL76271.1 hypothetical protein D8666_00150 [[Ochrobactrum] soli]TNV16334.1 hypothetical protein FIC94_10995 [[Ochrobactrum] teleogrylli]WHS30658.1 hypothetical protein QLQ09_12165 [Brucella sp. NM4]